MKIGFTYDLKSDYLALGFSQQQVAEFDVPETIDAIVGSLKKLGHEVEKIGNADRLIKKLCKGHRWDIVFNICEGLSGLGREAQVPAILDVYGIQYVFSDVLVMSVTLHKGMTKRIIRDAGIPTAPFFMVESIDDIYNNDLPYPLFVKPVAEGTGKGIGQKSRVNDFQGLMSICSELLNDFNQPVLVETFLPGSEVTVGIIGTGNNARVIGMMQVVFGQQSGIYSFENKSRYEEFIKYSKVPDLLYKKCVDTALRSWRTLGCRDGGRVDLRLDQHGIPNFLEVNPLAGLNPVHSDLPILSKMAGISFDQLISMIFNSALQRLQKQPHSKLPDVSKKC